MATIQITVPDATVNRILTAFGHWGVDPATIGTWVPSDLPTVRAAIKDYVKQQVQDYEARQAQTTAAASVRAETW